MGNVKRYLVLYGAFVIGLVALLSVVNGTKAYAVSSEFLDSSNTFSPTRPWSDAYLSVAWRGTDIATGQSIGLEARTSVTRVFYKIAGTGATGLNTFSITVVDVCRPGFYTINGDVQVSLEAFNGMMSTPLAGRTNLPNSGGNCVGNDMVFTVNRNELTTAPSSYGSDYLVAQVRVVKVTQVGTKWFRVRSNDVGQVTFAELRRDQTAFPGNPGYGTAFSMQDANSSEPATSEREYMFRFTPDCAYVPTYNTAYVKWFDADYGDSVEQGSNNISFTLTVRSFSTGAIKFQTTVDISTTPDIGHDDEFRELQFPVTGPDDDIEWHWYNVNRFNGIQVWMPFSEMQTFVAGANGCGTTGGGELYSADCSLVEGWASDPDYPGAVNVIATVDGPYGSGAEIGMTLANRADPTHGNHGFRMNYAGPVDTNTHQVYAYMIDVDSNGVVTSNPPVLLSGSPKTVPACGGAPDEFKLEPQVVSISLNDDLAPTSGTLSTRVDPQLTIPVPGILATATRYVTVIKASGVTTTNVLGTETKRFLAAGDNYNDNYNFAPFNLGPGDRVCTYINVMNTYHGTASAAGTTLSVIEPSKNSPLVCQMIMSRPYLSSYGGDVRAGGAFGDNVCVPSAPNATIKTFARQLGPGQAQGSSVQFAAFALGAIDGDSGTKGFFSASTRNGMPQPHDGLTFANTNGAWGGNFDVADHCIPDFTTLYQAGTVTALPSTDISTLPTGTYEITQSGPNAIVLTATGDVSNNVTIIVHGNVILKRGGIMPGFRYGAAWPTINSIPSLAIIADGGNMYVDYEIAQLDGIYVAQPTAGSPTTTGIIYTCADSNDLASPAFDPVTQQNRFGDVANGCARTALTINGAFAAQQVRFSRTVNSVRDSIVSPGENLGNSRAAEIFSYGPEMFLGMLNSTVPTNASSGVYDSITTLPPIY